MISHNNHQRLFPPVTERMDTYSTAEISKKIIVGIGGTECEEPGCVFRLLHSVLEDYPATDIAILQYVRGGVEQTAINFVHSRGLFEGFMEMFANRGIAVTTNFAQTHPSDLTLSQAVKTVSGANPHHQPICYIIFNGALTGSMAKEIIGVHESPVLWAADFDENGLAARVLREFREQG
jgi:hypothetical protein